MEEYSERCAPPWSAQEIEHKLQSATNQSRQRKGYLLGNSHLPADVNPNRAAELDQALWDNLRDNGPEVIALYEHEDDINRPNRAGWGLTSWSMSLATSLVKAGWAEQDIATILISHWRKWSPDTLCELEEGNWALLAWMLQKAGEHSEDNGSHNPNHESNGQERDNRASSSKEGVETGEEKAESEPKPPKKGAAAPAPKPQPTPWPPPIPFNEIPPPVPMPLEVFPGPVRRLVDEIAWSVNCPPDWPATAVLAVAGGAIGNSRAIAIKRSWVEPALGFFANVGNAGTAKSTPVDIAARPLFRAQERFHKEWKESVKVWEEEQKQKDSQKRPKPQMARCVTRDTTTESLALRLTENPRGIAWIIDELAGMVEGLNQYKGGKGSDRQFILSLWSQATLCIDRKSSNREEPLYVPHPHVPIIGGIQPSVLERLRGSAERGSRPPEDGFLDRWLWSYPDIPKQDQERWGEVSQEAEVEWACVVDTMLHWQMVAEDDRRRPFCMNLTTSAREAWETFTADHAAEVNSDSFPICLSGPWSKMRAYCARLALIIRCLRVACDEVRDSNVVDADDIARGAALVSYFKCHARRVYGTMSADPRITAAQKLLGWIQRRGKKEFKKWEPYRDMQSETLFPTPESLDAPLRLLEEHQHVRCVEVQYSGTGRKPGGSYQVNPATLERVLSVFSVSRPPLEREGETEIYVKNADIGHGENYEKTTPLSPSSLEAVGKPKKPKKLPPDFNLLARLRAGPVLESVLAQEFTSLGVDFQAVVEFAASHPELVTDRGTPEGIVWELSAKDLAMSPGPHSQEDAQPYV